MMSFQLLAIKVLVKASVLIYGKAQDIIKKTLPGDQLSFVQMQKIVLKNGTASWILLNFVKIAGRGDCELNSRGGRK